MIEAEPIMFPYRRHLKAVDPLRNIARAYEVEACEDLFGHIVIELSWSRIGTKGQSKRLSFRTKVDASNHLNRVIKRRQSAQKRIGVAYRDSRKETKNS